VLWQEERLAVLWQKERAAAGQFASGAHRGGRRARVRTKDGKSGPERTGAQGASQPP
jgi:hypothetical protein